MGGRWLWCAVPALCGLSFLAGGVLAQEDESSEGMEIPEWAKPTKEHEDFKKAVGTWNVAMRWWEDPAREPMASKGTAVMSIVMNGFFLKQEFKGDMMGIPFEGLGFVGYDTIDREFVSIWMDSWSPIAWIGRGSEKDGILTYLGQMPNYQGGKARSASTLKWDNDDQMTMVFYNVLEDGTRQKNGELVYTRRK